MDRLTKMSHFIPTTTHTTAEDLVQLHLKHVWKHHRVPRVHNTDRGSLFTADYTCCFFKVLHIDQHFLTAYHPQTQGQVKNNNKWVKTYICMFCNHQQNNWANLLHTAEFAYNNHHHPSISMSPFKANNGYDMMLTGEGPTWGRNIPLRLNLLTRLHMKCKMWLEQAQKKQTVQYNKKHADIPPLKEGNLVWLDSKDLATDQPSPKLEALRFSPFKIEQVTGPLMYRLEVPEDWRVNHVFHRSKLHPITPDMIPKRENHITLPTNVTVRENQDISQVVNGSQPHQTTPQKHIQQHAHHPCCQPPALDDPLHKAHEGQMI